MKTRRLCAGLVVALVVLSGVVAPRAAQQATIRERLIGNWRLVSTESIREGEAPELTLGPSPVGMISYTADGHMLVNMADPRRPTVRVADATPGDLRTLLRTVTAYFGTFTVDEAARQVTHHRDGSASPGERDLVRSVEFSGRRLILTTPTTTVDGKKRHGRITWERLDNAPAAAGFDAGARSAVIGTWALVEHQTTLADGSVRRNYGDKPRGLFVFSADGRATVQITNAERPASTVETATDDEVRALFRSYLAYFGTFDVDPARNLIVVHTVSDLNPANTSADQQRFFSFDGNRMFLQPPPTPVPGGQQLSRITWERVK